MSVMEQDALFEMPVPPKLTHDWMWRPLGPSECASCLELWFAATGTVAASSGPNYVYHS